MKNLIIAVLLILGFSSSAYAFNYFQVTTSMLPGVTDTYYIGTSSPSTLEYNGIFTKNLTVSGTCTGCSSGGVTSLSQTYGTAQTGALTIGSSTTAINNDWGITNIAGAFTINLPSATDSVRGLLTAADHATFNGKQAAGNYITALTSDVTASGPGSAAATIAANAVTYAKFQQVGAFKLLGNFTSATANVAEVATSSIFAPCTAGQVLGYVTGGSGPQCVATSSASAAFSGTTGQVDYFSGTNTAIGTSTIFIGTNRNVGISSTTPWGQLSVNASSTIAQPQFVVGSSTGTNLIVSSGGLTGLNTTNPLYQLDVTGAGHFTSLLDAANFVATSTSATSTFAGGLTVGTSQLFVQHSNGFVGVNTASPVSIFQTHAATNENFIVQGHQNFTEGVGFACVNDANGANVSCEFRAAPRLGFDAVSSGFLDFMLNGVESARLDSTGNLGLSTTSPWGKLSVGTFNLPVTSPSLVVASSSTGLATTTQLILLNGSLGIGTTTPSSFFSAAGNGYFTGGLGLGLLNSTAGSLLTSGSISISSTSPFTSLVVDRGTGMASSSILVNEYKYGNTGNIATSTSQTIDCRTSNQQHWRLGAAATTLTLSGLRSGQKCIVVIENPNGTAGALTWAVASGYQLFWPGGTTPTQTTTANKEDVWSFLATEASSTIAIFGAQSANF